jgi:hypothetical protein
MRRCADLAGEPFANLVGDLSKWLERLRTERDDLAHHLQRTVSASSDQYYLAESAYWLFVVCILRAADAPDAAFASIQNSQQFQMIGSRLRPTL